MVKMIPETVEAGIKAMKRFPIGEVVVLTTSSPDHTPIIELGTVVKYALNSFGEPVIGVEVVCPLTADCKSKNFVRFVHPENKVTSIQPVTEL
jgi:hypothetical protein